ncbi:phosphoribosyltransferase family protein [Microbacterium trichothecenolyticum]|uniref:Adenine phosphoribosyltransferase n=1 Tax=Microbacterium trichothecenolyticum TaxID=69370 RepID=A0ABU0TSP6_MICTR|nr:phosphoribosyltransferase family protein [Microbacterium trichothecenolyticum]MDQ1122475.1 adenine phosphoribosyltransferase [Microbacterium trichothecenolyticum]
MDIVRERLRSTFRWVGDRTDRGFQADVTGWWRDPLVVERIGRSLAGLFDGEQVNVVVGPESRGSLLGALVARELGVGLAEVRKDGEPLADSDRWWEVSSGPDYRDRHLRMGLRRSMLRAGDRALFVDDWIDTGAQTAACHALVEMSGARWVGAAVVVDAFDRPDLRRALRVRSLLHVRDLR